MSTRDGASLAEQRLRLRRALGEQRARIAQQLPAPREREQAYPRSKTMRFLRRHAGSTLGVVAELSGIFGIGRLPLALRSALLGARMLRALRSRRPPG